MTPNPGMIMMMFGEKLDEETLATALRLCRECGFETMGAPFQPSKEFILAVLAIRSERQRVLDLLEQKKTPGIGEEFLTDFGILWNAVIDRISTELRGDK